MIKVKFSPARSRKRQSVRFRSVDFHATSSVIEMVLRDLNSEGMSIETRQQLRVGASYPFRIRRGQRSVLIDGNVIWCKLARMIDIGGGESQALYRAGIAFSSRRLEEFSAVRLEWHPGPGRGRVHPCKRCGGRRRSGCGRTSTPGALRGQLSRLQGAGGGRRAALRTLRHHPAAGVILRSGGTWGRVPRAGTSPEPRPQRREPVPCFFTVRLCRLRPPDRVA